MAEDRKAHVVGERHPTENLAIREAFLRFLPAASRFQDLLTEFLVAPRRGGFQLITWLTSHVRDGAPSNLHVTVVT